jgi:uncharacterized protein YoxC
VISPELVEASVAGITLLGAVITWLWRTASSVGKAHTTLAIFTSDVAALKVDTRELRDNHIRADSAIANLMNALAKLDKIDTLITSVATLTAIVERLERRVDRRSDGDHDNG